MSSKKETAGLVLFLFFMTIAGITIAGDTYNYKASCPQNGGKKVEDIWKFYQCECTSYAADKMNEHGVKFNNYYKGSHWGYADNWIIAAKKAGVPYDKNPKHRDIAWFSIGHVAYVEDVDSKGNIKVSDYNHDLKHDYAFRTINKGSTNYPTVFIHFGAK